MPIPEDQLATWANIGAQETSKTTYATVKAALESTDAGYNDRTYDVFLQGSYGNDTNIWKESDVDVVIRLNSVFSYDDSALSLGEKAAWRAAYGPDSTYNHNHFRSHVLEVLRNNFEGDVQEGSKAVSINARGNRRKADVVIALIHKRYVRFDTIPTERVVNGIAFWKSNGTRVINYPNQHRENLVAKNQETNEWFKHIIRIFKNARQRMLQDSSISVGTAPSYYIEGLLYNVPSDRFGNSYADSVIKCLNWLIAADRTAFWCANKQYRLLDGSADVSWNSKDCSAYLNGLARLWNAWK